MSYSGPLLPLTTISDASGIEVERNIDFDFSPYKWVQEGTVDIYGEESCVAIEVMSKGYDILYSNKIKVNHRVNKEQRRNHRWRD